MGLDATLGVYVSVPFCRAKCSFCNFASGVAKGDEIERYVAKLCAEIDAARLKAERMGARLAERVDSVYFGGGTPSLLSPEQLRRVFGALRGQFTVDAGAEITLEAAPGQIGDEVLHAAQELGVNRVSLGVQSFVDRESAAVGRLHTERDCVVEIVRLRAAGMAELGADLIAGLPYQTAESFAHSLAVATSVGLTHLSVYMLEVDEDSRLGQEVMAGGTRFHAHGVPADELAADFYEMACAWLPEHGFAQYEISNFAAAEQLQTQIPFGNDNNKSEGHVSRHNLKYWQRAPYVGFGLDAHSMLLGPEGAVRFSNPEELQQYGLIGSEVKPLYVSEREAFEEAVFLGLRLTAGLRLEGLRREWIVEFEDAARALVREGLMTDESGCWRLTGRGRLVSNAVFGALLEGVAA